MPGFQFYFELIGAVAFAISGAALAVKKHMDLFGVPNCRSCRSVICCCII